MVRAWVDAVRLLTELDGSETSTKFQVGDLVLEQVPMGDDQANNGSLEKIRQLAEESGLSFETLRQRRVVAARIPHGRRLPCVSYSVYVLIAFQSTAEERERLLTMIQDDRAPTSHGRWTVDSLRTYLGMKPTRYPPPSDETPEAKQATFVELAADPVIVTEAARFGSPTSQALGTLESRKDSLRQEDRERETQSDPVLRRIDQMDASLDVEAACRRFAQDLATMTERFARDIDKALPRTGPAREQPLVWIRRSIEQARASLDALEGFTETGESDIDTFLGEVLGGVR